MKHNLVLLWFPSEGRWLMRCRECGQDIFEITEEEAGECKPELPVLGVSVSEGIKAEEKIG